VSISKFREFVEKSGCGWIVAIVTSVIMLMGLVQCMNPGAQGGPGAQAGEGDIAVIGDTPLSLTYVNNFADRTRQQMQQQAPERTMTLEDEASVEGHALEQSVIAGLLIVLANKEGVTINEASIQALMDKQAKDAWAAQKETWVKEKKLTANATEAQFNDLYKKTYGNTPAEILELNHKMLAERINGPESLEIKVSYANTLLIEHFASKIPSAEADVLKSYDQYNAKRIVMEKAKHPGKDLVAELNKIKKEIEGGMTFEAAMDKYSDEAESVDPKDAKKKRPKHENVFQLDGTTAQINESYAPIAALKPGQISEPLGFPNTVELYRLDSVTSSAPADFKAKFEEYRKQFVEPRAVTKMQDGITALKGDTSAIKWKSEGYHALYDKQLFNTDPKNFALDPAARRKALEGIFDRAQKAIEGDPVGSRVATLVAYSTMEEIYNSTEPKDRAPLETRREELLQKLSDTLSDPSVSMKLVGTFAERKDKEKLFTALEKVASNLMGSLDANGQRIFAELNSSLDRFVKDKLITPEQAKAIRDRLEDWKKAKIDNDKYEAEAKRAADEQKKADEAAEKKAAEDLKKEEEAAKKEAAKSKDAPKTEEKKSGG
jgi:SurA N-terminal domain